MLRLRRCTIRPRCSASGWPARRLPDLPHVAVFDTAFFHDLPPAAATYAIDRDIAERWHIRRYGFHGTSHQYVSEQAAAFLDVPLASLSQIVLHLGNGASASAIVGGRPVDTSMGLTPMEGLVMGTRSGDIDPGVITYLSRTAGMSVEDIETMLNRRAGVRGLGGEIDFRVLHQRIESGDEAAQLAYDVYIHRLRKYIGAYLALLGARRRHHLHRRGGGERRGGATRCAFRHVGAGHRARRAPQRQPGQGRAPDLGRQLADDGASDSHQRGARDRARLRGGDLTWLTLTAKRARRAGSPRHRRTALIVEYLSICCALGHDLTPRTADRRRTGARAAPPQPVAQTRCSLQGINRALMNSERSRGSTAPSASRTVRVPPDQSD